MAGVDDCWDAFGSDSDDNDNDNDQNDEQASAANKEVFALLAGHLAQAFVKANAQIRLSDRIVGVNAESGNISSSTGLLVSSLGQRGITVTPIIQSSEKIPRLDALVILQESQEATLDFHSALLPGGIFITNQGSLYYDKEAFLEPTTITQPTDDDDDDDDDKFRLVEYVKRPIRVHTSKCLWLPPSHSVSTEEKLLHSATVCPSAYELSKNQLTDGSIQHAVQNLKDHGYCVIRGVLETDQCVTWGRTVLESVHSAAQRLLERDQVDIYHPHTSKCEPQAYRELSMREDLRLDLRHGPELSALRARDAISILTNNINDDDEEETQVEERGNEPMVLSSHTKSLNGFLRGNANLLEILRRTMNPKKDDLYKGNLGRYNFGGSGADGSFQDLRVSAVGGIVTFGGCGDQSIHADTPHLFEHIPDLPAHYINIFAAATPFHEKVGGTAFVHGSHNLEFTAKHCGSSSGYHAVYPSLVRPCLDLGDVVLFDCRILHFGMSNTSDNTERVLLYTNTTQAWFHDPKNWDDRRPIFEKE